MNRNIHYLIRYYTDNIDNIKASLKARDIDTYIVENIQQLITQLNDLSREFNIVCAQRKHETDKQLNIENRIKKKQITKATGKVAIELKKQLLTLPNILKTYNKDDEIIEIIHNSNDTTGIKFTDFYKQYTYIHEDRCLFYYSHIAIFKRKLVNALIEHNIRNGFKYIEVPIIVNNSLLEHTGHFPKFKSYTFSIDSNKTLIPTSEVSILEFISLECQKNKTLTEQQIVCYSYCFRNETSATSKVNKSMIRQSVFEKVETFVICHKDNREKYMTILMNNVKHILNFFKINYRIIKVGSLEISQSAYIQYDFEVYMPKSDMYIEIASCSDCDSYQLYRNIVFKHYYNDFCTLNCSALPIDRLLACLVEYYWCEQTQTLNIDINNI